MQEDVKIGQISPEISPQPPSPEEKIEGERKREEEGKQPTMTAEGSREVFVAPKASAPAPKVPTQAPPAEKKSEELLAIEEILEDGLEEAYWQMPPPLRKEFKERGEKTAKKIERLIRGVHLNMLKVLRLIRKWLAMIPKVNQFFLEQEAKIKTDKVVALHRERKQK